MCIRDRCVCVSVCLCVCVSVCVCFTTDSHWDFPMGNSGYFPGESQPRQSRTMKPTVHAGCFSVSIIHRTLTRTTRFLTCCEKLLCYQFRTVEAILWPVEAWGGISIQFGEFSYVNFLHFYRLSFSSLIFTNFFPFCSLYSSHFYLFIETFVWTLLDWFLHVLVS